MMKHFPLKSRREAVQLGQVLMDNEYIHHVCREQPFRDGYFFYRFEEDSKVKTSFVEPQLTSLITCSLSSDRSVECSKEMEASIQTSQLSSSGPLRDDRKPIFTVSVRSKLTPSH